MIITLGQARTALAEFAGKGGKCASSEDVRLFVIGAVQRLLLQGANGNLRKWTFCLQQACFTAPPDMEVPIKVKIEGRPERVWSHWYEFYDVNGSDQCDNGYQPGLFEEVNRYFTVYDLPKPGARLAAVPLTKEAPDSFITVQGRDVNGREVYTKVNGKVLHGEKLLISREKPTFSKTVFAEITGIEKSKTDNYVRLYWQKHAAGNSTPLSRGLLAEYRPTDTYPVYRRFRVPMAQSDCLQKVSVIGRVAIMEFYHDNDVLPVTSLPALRTMAQTLNAEQNKDLNTAIYMDKKTAVLIDDENQYKRTGQEGFDFLFDTSPGANENLQ